ncbi:hypothetical protein EMIHUDRAFT_218766 [Emiliania huxleyi CCMP1516]|uniref:Uncharacterized protein n=2 Tax=Emiliania huxleyi TaxID=2903 RepID=A0A0D3I6X3_EMIH1|nr:hypothetical protein EMIHUDRAFT_218766 [Emiliania huxleyi CCMP1516]EOD07008.1 hypothetical protein EMIHUDRAFT_218766 [Emiliania huxleyi CCMP1516]|eukprot:XP_005759437.1 hypothetical protein EMIHUDRAFT_218766 [Emiliania huxleyi CCMP1516]
MSQALLLNRVLPRRGGSGRLKRVESAPSLLTPVWEPEHGEEAEEPPPAMPSRGSLPTYSASSLDLPMLHRECKSDEGALQPRQRRSTLWQSAARGESDTRLCALGMLELVAAASERLQSDPLPLEVFAHPTFVCVVMRWGMHEVDGSHQLAAVIAEAVRLLRELLPSGGQSRYLRLSSSVLQRLLLRMACLDSHLGDSLWLP